MPQPCDPTSKRKSDSFADIGQKFQVADSVIQTTITHSPSLTRSEKKHDTRDHPSLGDKLLILHLLDNCASVKKLCSDFLITKTSLYWYKKEKQNTCLWTRAQSQLL